MRGTVTPIWASRSRMGATAAAASVEFTVRRTSSEPARASDFTCWAVPSTSAVSVFVIDWTTMGLGPPTRTGPMVTGTLFRRGWLMGFLRMIRDLGGAGRQRSGAALYSIRGEALNRRA